MQKNEFFCFVAWDNTVYKPGDCVYVDSQRMDMPYFIGNIQSFKMTKRDQLNISIKWYFRPCEIPETVYRTLVQDRHVENNSTGVGCSSICLKDPAVQSRELFISDAVDTYSISAIRGKCVVYHLKDIGRTAKDTEKLTQPDSFFYVLGYNPENNRLASILGEIRVGPSHQARLPELRERLTDHNTGAKTLLAPDDEKIRETLAWCPEGLADSDILMYIRAARSMAAFAGMCDGSSSEDGCVMAGRDQTTINAYDSLHANNYETGPALEYLVKNPAPDLPDKKWTEEETKKFIRGLKLYGKNFFKIRQELLAQKTTGQLIEFYYLWKKTPAANSQRPRPRQRRPQATILRRVKTAPSNGKPPRPSSNEFLDLSSASENECDSDSSDTKMSGYACHHCYTTTSKNWHHAGKDKSLLCVDCRLHFKKYGELRPVDRSRTPPPFLFTPVKEHSSSASSLVTTFSNNGRHPSSSLVDAFADDVDDAPLGVKTRRGGGSSGKPANGAKRKPSTPTAEMEKMRATPKSAPNGSSPVSEKKLRTKNGKRKFAQHASSSLSSPDETPSSADVSLRSSPSNKLVIVETTPIVQSGSSDENSSDNKATAACQSEGGHPSLLVNSDDTHTSHSTPSMDFDASAFPDSSNSSSINFSLGAPSVDGATKKARHEKLSSEKSSSNVRDDEGTMTASTTGVDWSLAVVTSVSGSATPLNVEPSMIRQDPSTTNHRRPTVLSLANARENAANAEGWDVTAASTSTADMPQLTNVSAGMCGATVRVKDEPPDLVPYAPSAGLAGQQFGRPYAWNVLLKNTQSANPRSLRAQDTARCLENGREAQQSPVDVRSLVPGVKDPDPKVDDTEFYSSRHAVFRRHWYRGESNSCSRTDLVFIPHLNSPLAKKRDELAKQKAMAVIVKEEPKDRSSVSSRERQVRRTPPTFSTHTVATAVPSSSSLEDGRLPSRLVAAGAADLPCQQRLREYAAAAEMAAAVSPSSSSLVSPSSRERVDQELRDHHLLNGTAGIPKAFATPLPGRAFHQNCGIPFALERSLGNPPPSFSATPSNFLMTSRHTPSATNFAVGGPPPSTFPNLNAALTSSTGGMPVMTSPSPFTGGVGTAPTALSPYSSTLMLGSMATGGASSLTPGLPPSDPVQMDVNGLSALYAQLERHFALNPTPTVRCEMDRVDALLRGALNAAAALPQHHTHSHTHSHTHLHIHPTASTVPPGHGAGVPPSSATSNSVTNAASSNRCGVAGDANFKKSTMTSTSSPVLPSANRSASSASTPLLAHHRRHQRNDGSITSSPSPLSNAAVATNAASSVACPPSMSTVPSTAINRPSSLSSSRASSTLASSHHSKSIVSSFSSNHATASSMTSSFAMSNSLSVPTSSSALPLAGGGWPPTSATPHDALILQHYAAALMRGAGASDPAALDPMLAAAIMGFGGIPPHQSSVLGLQSSMPFPLPAHLMQHQQQNPLGFMSMYGPAAFGFLPPGAGAHGALDPLAAERMQQVQYFLQLQQQEIHRRLMLDRDYLASQQQAFLQHNEMMRRLQQEGNVGFPNLIGLPPHSFSISNAGMMRPTASPFEKRL